MTPAPRRFALGPDGSVFYANGTDTTVWSSERHRAAAVINYDAVGNAFRYDLTTRVTNRTQPAASMPTLVRDGSNDIDLLIGSTRPLERLDFTLSTVNTGASTTSVSYWNGTAWALVAGFVDNTALAGVTLAQSGSMVFNSTSNVARVKWEDERLLYFYKVLIGAGGTPDATIVVAQLTVGMQWHSVVDIWDGVERQPILCAAADRDYTLEVLETSTYLSPIGADLSGLATDQEVFVGFEDRLTALQVHISPGYSNVAPATLTLAYWSGAAWVAASNLSDTTVGGTSASMNATGILTWTAPAATAEFVQTMFGRTGYFYKLTWSVRLTEAPADEDVGLGMIKAAVLVDTITGIPAQRWNAQDPVPAYTFPFAFAGRILLAGAVGTNALNRIDYCAPARPDVWNGEQASDRGKEIYVGDDQALTCAMEMSNRYLNQIKQLAVVCKAGQTWLLEGSGPDGDGAFKLFLISDSVGCPASLSMCRAEIPVAQGDTLRNVVLFCSHKGPMIFDGSVLLPMRFPQPDGAISSIDVYFNPNDSRYVNTAYWQAVVGWYDSQWSEYNLLLPSGSGQTTCNTWLFCDLRHRRWGRKVPAVVYPQVGLSVHDVGGTAYSYGCLDTGHLFRLETGQTWGGSPIAHVLDTADIPYSGSVFDQSLARFVRVAAISDSGTGAVTIAHAIDGSGSFTTQATLTLNGSGRFQTKTQSINRRAFSHQWRLSSSTSDSARAPRLLGMAVEWLVERSIER